MSNRVINFSDSFTSASAPSTTLAIETYTIANNTTGGAVLTLAQATNKSAFVNYELRRETSGGVFIQTGSLMAIYDGAWSLSLGNFTGDDMLATSITSTEHVILAINSATGAITYDSGNMIGTGYVGTLKISITRIA